jgi:hypothetical protein
MKNKLADLIGQDCLTPEGERVTVELIATEENLPPRAIVFQKGTTNRRIFWVDWLKPMSEPNERADA